MNLIKHTQRKYLARITHFFSKSSMKCGLRTSNLNMSKLISNKIIFFFHNQEIPTCVTFADLATCVLEYVGDMGGGTKRDCKEIHQDNENGRK